MALSHLMTKLLGSSTLPGAANTVYGYAGQSISVYPRSVRMEGSLLVFVGREKNQKYLYAIAPAGSPRQGDDFEGESVAPMVFGDNLRARRCFLSHANAECLRRVFPFTRPVLIGTEDSFGFGDRLGIANPAHLRALSGSHMRPVLAQQSIRELDRTQRTAEDVLDAASWAAFQEGYTAGFGADADHLKTVSDIDRYARAGFTMYTFDPSAFVVNDAATLPLGDVRQRARKAAAGDLKEALARYAGRTYRLEDGTTLEPGAEEITRAFVKYGGVISHAALLYRHLRQHHAELSSEVELSVDETDIPTTPAEHLFVAGELLRLGVEIVSLAPRFIGEFEKGVDYRGDLKAFGTEYRLHAGIAKMMGSYKISIHSGSDKFSIYRLIGSVGLGKVHVKTAGTSYLEALRTAAMVKPDLIREILTFAHERFEEERLSYNVTARLDKVPKECTDRQLQDLFNQHDARQIFHVTYGKVLTERDAQGELLFRDRLMACLDQREDIHYDNLIRHFRKHLEPFSRAENRTA